MCVLLDCLQKGLIQGSGHVGGNFIDDGFLGFGGFTVPGSAGGFCVFGGPTFTSTGLIGAVPGNDFLPLGNPFGSSTFTFALSTLDINASKAP